MSDSTVATEQQYGYTQVSHTYTDPASGQTYTYVARFYEGFVRRLVANPPTKGGPQEIFRQTRSFIKDPQNPGHEKPLDEECTFRLTGGPNDRDFTLKIRARPQDEDGKKVKIKRIRVTLCGKGTGAQQAAASAAPQAANGNAPWVTVVADPAGDITGVTWDLEDADAPPPEEVPGGVYAAQTDNGDETVDIEDNAKTCPLFC